MKIRWAGPKSFAWRPEDGPRPWLWPEPGVELPAEVWLVEGEAEAGILRYASIQAFTVTKGAEAGVPVEVLRRLKAAGVSRICVLFDADDVGRKGAEKVARAVREAGLEVVVVDPVAAGCRPELGLKDVRDLWLMLGRDPGRLRKALEKAVEARPVDSPAGRDAPTWDPVPVDVRGSELDVDWVWGQGRQGFLARNRIAELYGLWKSGKTTLVAALLSHLGREFLSLPTQPVRTLVVSEQSADDWARYADDFSISPELVEKICRPFLRAPTWEDWEKFCARVGELIRERGYGLIILDALPNLWPVYDENDAGQVLRALRPVLLWAEAGAAVLLVRHPRKSDGAEATAGRGSGAVSGFVDIIVEFRRYAPKDATDQRRVLTVFSRLEPFETVFEWAGGANFVVLGSRRDVDRADRAGVLLEVLPATEPGLTLDEIREVWPERPVPARTALQELLRHLMDRGQVLRSGIGVRGDPFRYRRTTPGDGQLDNKNLSATIDIDSGRKESRGAGDGRPHPEGLLDNKFVSARLDHYSGGKESVGDPEPCPVLGGEVAPAYRLVTEPADLDRVVAELAGAQVLGLDCETTGLDPHADRLRLIQLQPPGGPVYVIDCFAVDPRALGPVLQGARLLIGHNLKFDLRFLMAAGLPIPEGARLFDTMLAAQLLDGTAAPPGLKELAARFLSLKLEKELQKADWSGTLSPAMLEYAARDAAILPPLYEALAQELEAAGLGQAAELESRALPAVAWLEHTGAPFDVEGWRAACDRALAAKLEAVEKLKALADRLGFGPEINWDSPQQVLKLLRAAGVAVEDTREEALARHRDRPPVEALLAYREAARRCGTYGQDWLRYVHRVTGRIHADWRQIGAASGRMACRDPNLQNIPRDPQYRACFRPGPGRVLVKADYSQIELRIAAELSGDRRLLEAFSRREDLHVLTAALVLGKSPGAVTGEDRRLAKAINFGLLYGMGPRAFAEHAQAAYGVGLTEAEAARLRERFFQAYPELRAWHRRARGDGPVEVRTASGRRRVVNSFTERLNTPVQGTGADGLKLALALLWETRDRCPGAAPVLAVHDELVVEADAGEAEAARDWLVGCMRRGMEAFLKKVPVEVEAVICRDWAGTGPSP
jgi:DNA polymerase-1